MSDTIQNDHSRLVYNLAKSGEDIYRDISPGHCALIHMTMGICGEAGELLDAIKKHVIYNKPLDLVNIVEELGDMEFYIEGLRQALGIDRGDTLMKNFAKLNKRYATGYSDAAAQARADKLDGE